MRASITLMCLVCAAFLAACGGDSSETAGTADVVVAIPPDIAGDEFQPFDTPPVLVHFEEPEYPVLARRGGVEGTVMVKVVVGTDGRVVEAMVLESSNDMLSPSALDAARACTFTPGELGGEPVRCAVAIPFKYALM